MNCLFMTLKGGMRSWGVTSVGDDRWTGQWPTASAILGLAGACMGVDRHSPEQVTAWYNGFLVCTLSAIAYRKPFQRFTKYHPSILSDLQTTKNSLNMNGKRRKDTIMSHRGYITDGLDVAAVIPVHTDAEDWLEQLAFAIQQPCYTPYLGRRSNSLSAPLAEPGEGVMSFSSADSLCEHLFWSLSNLQIGELQPAECMLRIPSGLWNETDDFLSKWDCAGREVVADHRPGFLRFFKNHTVLMYRRTIEDQTNGIQ